MLTQTYYRRRAPRIHKPNHGKRKARHWAICLQYDAERHVLSLGTQDQEEAARRLRLPLPNLGAAPNEPPVIKWTDDRLLSVVEIGETRWLGMPSRIVSNKLRAWNVPAIRLGSRTIKYRLSDIVRVENEAATRTMANFRKKKAAEALGSTPEVGANAK